MDDLVTLLSSRCQGFMNPPLTALQDVLFEIPDPARRVQPYVTEPSEYPYGRNVIYRNEQLEIIVVNLPPRSQTFIHDHGYSIGCGRVVEGELANVEFEAIGPRTARRTSESRISAGELFLTPHGTIHQMLNPGEQRVISLHVYAPPLHGLKLYEEQRLPAVFPS